MVLGTWNQFVWRSQCKPWKNI